MPRDDSLEESLTWSIIGAFFEVYNTLSYGLLEQVYARALEIELVARGLRVTRELWVPVYYKGVEISRQRIDFVIEDRVVVENKSTKVLDRAAFRQLFSYLNATRFEVGLLHFGPEANFYRLISSNQKRKYSERKSVRSAQSAESAKPTTIEARTSHPTKWSDAAPSPPPHPSPAATD